MPRDTGESCNRRGYNGLLGQALSHSTVRSHLKRVFDKTDVHSQAALLALLRGFVAPSR